MYCVCKCSYGGKPLVEYGAMENIRLNKILNIIKYFVKNTNNVGKTKLFKLLYYLDFMYIKKHGLSITLYDYYAFDYGPVPLELYEQINRAELPEILSKDIEFRDIVCDNEDNSYSTCKVLLKDKEIDYQYFAPYEIDMLKEIAFIFKNATATEMTEASHLKNQPWDRTKKTKGMYKKIDFALASDSESIYDKDMIIESLELQKDLESYGVS